MRTINAMELRDRLNLSENMLLLNALTREEFEREHIPGSDNIPVDAPDFLHEVERLAGSRERPIVVYCAGPECHASERAARMLDDAQFTNVSRFEGGLKVWKKMGFGVTEMAVPH
jgi:rhodanese-related sulfurtransferase